MDAVCVATCIHVPSIAGAAGHVEETDVSDDMTTPTATRCGALTALVVRACP